jgi:nucleolar pre-ribosomal-associated protein 1
MISQLSSHLDKGPLFILIGELVETAKLTGLATPLASILTEFAAAAVEMLMQPSHPMYGKINKFLQKRPSWELSKFIGYWIETILLHEPEEGGSHSEEMSWLLRLLTRGLYDLAVLCPRSDVRNDG